MNTRYIQGVSEIRVLVYETFRHNILQNSQTFLKIFCPPNFQILNHLLLFFVKNSNRKNVLFNKLCYVLK
jgi:hypothetical protein